jgi:hypothetical protein
MLSLNSFCDIIAGFRFARTQAGYGEQRIFVAARSQPKSPQAHSAREIFSPKRQKLAGKRFHFAAAVPQNILRPKRRGVHHP